MLRPKRTPEPLFAGLVPVLIGLIVAATHPAALAAETATPQGPYYGQFRELPISAITPKGWLGELLQRQRDGLGLRHAASGYPFDTCLWAGTIPGKSWPRYEQTAYLLDGLYRCGILVHSRELIRLGRKNIQYVLDHPQPDGRIGPDAETLGGLKPGGLGTGQWPFAVFTRLLIAEYAVTQNPAILEALTRHYLALPAELGEGRDVDTVEGMCWLYGQTGDRRILEVAERTWNNATANPRSQFLLANLAAAAPMHGHGVTVCEQSKQPALLYLYTGKKEYLEAAQGVFRSLERDHQLVDGVVTSDAPLSGKAPEHQHETCVISDYTWSLGYLLMADGDPHWADTIERAVLNAGLSVIGKDFKTHQYYGSPNQVVATQTSNVPTTGVKYRNLQAYRPDFKPECCTGNVQRMLPNFAARMWLSAGGGGLAAVFYAPCAVHAKVGPEQIPIAVSETTDYPFQGTVDLKILTKQPVAFPLYLRIPGWANGARVRINGQPLPEPPTPGTLLKIERTFADQDTVQLDLPMRVVLERPVPQAVSVVRGPLVYSLRIREQRSEVRETLTKDPSFPAWNLTAGSPWNYALALDGPRDAEKIQVKVRPMTTFPWTPESVPVVMTVPARRVPAWVLAAKDANPPLPSAPFELAREIEPVELIPHGATLLRVAVFPAADAGSPP